MMKLSFSSLGSPKMPIDKFAGLVKAAGYDAMEVRGRPGEHVHWQDSPQRRQEVRKIFSDLGLEILSVSTYVFMASRDRGNAQQTDTRDEAGNIEELKKFVDLAGDLGAKNVRVFGGAMTAGETHKDALPRVARIMAAGAKVNPGINVCLESHDVWNTGKFMAEVLAAAAEPNCKCLFDIAGPAHAGEAPQKFLKAVPPEKIAYLHVKDFFHLPGPEPKMYGCFIGAGELPVAKVVALLKKANWDGYLNNEWEGVYHPYMPPVEDALVQGALKLREYLGKQA
jgi:sugar phosphate isomerase/epimerase